MTINNLGIRTEKGLCIKGLFGPLLSQKLKVVFHQFHLVGLLEE